MDKEQIAGSKNHLRRNNAIDPSRRKRFFSRDGAYAFENGKEQIARLRGLPKSARWLPRN